VLRFARTEFGARSLHRHAAALHAIAADRIAGRPPVLTPQVVTFGAVDDLPWLIETRLPGRDARVAAGRVGRTLVTAHAAAALGVLHEATAEARPLDEAALVQWVDDPIAELRTTGGNPLRAGADHAALDRLQLRLRDDLSGRPLTSCFVHGDFWLGNVLATDDGTVTGIVDWERAGAPGLASVDLMTLVLTGRVEARRRELGPVVRDLLTGGPLDADEQALLRTGPDADELDERTVVLLAWLHHAASNLQKRKYYRANTIWITTNVEHVLEKV
jgi:aminoglycoside phosphotransferase (APT) family kinase protein